MLRNTSYISVIIPTYNRAAKLGITLKSFLAQDYPQDMFEIIVVNNNSTDNTGVVVEGFARQAKVKVRYIVETRQGVHYARNTAALEAQGSILYFTDDDMVADPGLLRNIVAGFSCTPKVGVVGGLVLPQWECDPPAWVLEYCQNIYLSLSERKETLVVAPHDVGVFSCHEAILREVFLKSGGFNPENTAGEWIGDGETGLHIKIAQMGYDFVYTARAVIYHMIPAARMTQAYFNRRLVNQGNADCYTEYRRDLPGPWPLFVKILKDLLSMSECFAYQGLVRRILGKQRWHDFWARGYYYASRCRYNFRLLWDEPFRAMVLRRDWLSETGS